MTEAAIAEAVQAALPAREAVEALSASRNEPDWLRHDRLSAYDLFLRLAWPSPDEELWRRTPLAQLPRGGFTLPPATADPAALTAVTALGLPPAAGTLAHVDGAVIEQLLSDDLRRQGVLLLPLSEAARAHAALVRAHLHRVTPVAYDRFTALSAALWTQGVFLYVPKNVQIDAPLRSLATKTRGGVGLFSHTLIVAEALSAVTLIDASAAPSAPGASLLHRTVEIVAGEGASVRYLSLQDWGADAQVLVTQRVRQERDSTVLTASVPFGGALHKERLEIDAVGDGAQTDIFGIFLATGHQHVEFTTRQDQHAVGTRTGLEIRGAVDGHARAVQYGSIRLNPAAQKANAYQILRNLLLSEHASADPIPVLEIEADDVKCSHAAAVGPVDPEHLFYLQSRGIPAAIAERMVVQGFLDVVVDRLPDPAVREAVHALVARKLDQEAGA